MKNFLEFLAENTHTSDLLLEKLITFGGQAYPKFGNIIIMAGGAGSGKGFVLKNLIGAEGKVFDVDELKKISSKLPGVRKRVKDELGVDLEVLTKDLRDPDNVAQLHDIVNNFLGLDSKAKSTFFSGVLAAAPERKPNIIFDVTLKDLYKLQSITRMASEFGYDKKNIHIVWVVNDIEVAKAQNLERDRQVPVEILVNTHRGAQQTMGDILEMGSSLKRYMDGDIVFAFNKVNVDSKLVKSGKGGKYVKDADYFYVKRAGKPSLKIDQLSKNVRQKIASYVPGGLSWKG